VNCQKANSLEIIILFFVLFYPGIHSIAINGAAQTEAVIHFHELNELARTLTYTIPAIALLWYIISDKNGFSALLQEKIKKTDLIPFAAGLLGLALIGTGLSLVISHLAENRELIPPPQVQAPSSVFGWTVMVISCIGTGYLEESYFRYYLLSGSEKIFPKTVIMIIFSIFLFSICHLYEGPWGVANAVMAGTLLSILFIRFRSLHGIAWAHGFYNIFVYAVGSFTA